MKIDIYIINLRTKIDTVMEFYIEIDIFIDIYMKVGIFMRFSQ